jgi:uncharacterized protein (TIGR03083 family)
LVINFAEDEIEASEDRMSNEITKQQRDQLLERIRSSRAALDQVVGRLGEAQLTTPGPDGGWAVKDHLAHLAAWEQKMLAMVRGRPGYEGLQVDAATYEASNLDQLNAILHERFKALRAADVLAESQRSYAQVLAAVEPLSPAELGARYAPDDDPEDARRMIDGIVDNTYGHYDEHRAAIEEIIAAL